LKVAIHYGCHLLRPHEVVQFDNPFAPTKLDRLVEVTGAESIPWDAKLDCCGSPLVGVDDELSIALMEKKIRSAYESGADCICVVCPACHYQFDRVQNMMASAGRQGTKIIPSILFQQLLGFSLGIDKKDIGLKAGPIGD
jgi:heterodisulfide reductase subunit B